MYFIARNYQPVYINLWKVKYTWILCNVFIYVISALDISFVMKPTKQKFDVTMEGLLLHMLKNALKLADDVFLRLTLHPLRGARASDRLGLEDIETESGLLVKYLQTSLRLTNSN